MTKREMPIVDEDELSPKSKVQVNALQVYAEDMANGNITRDEKIQILEDEVAILKGEKKRPLFKSSGMDKNAVKAADNGQADGQAQADGKAQDSEQTPAQDPEQTPEQGKNTKAKRPGSKKESKTAQLVIDEHCTIKPTEPIPKGSRFKGYYDFVVQDIVFTRKNTCYRLEQWQTPDGRTLKGKLPDALRGGHFGPTLIAFVLCQYHQNHVTQPRLRVQLGDIGVEISKGQVNGILLNGKAAFHAEKDALLTTGLVHASYLTVDDTGARHKGVNCYVTHIGNPYFASFHTSDSKSRINFLEILQAGQTKYLINSDALAHMAKHGMAPACMNALSGHADTAFKDREAWSAHLNALGIRAQVKIRIATEGALLGGLSGLHIAENMAIISDDAGQFNVLTHGLCWVHAERLIHKLQPLNDRHRDDIAWVRSEIWKLYADLKAYKEQPAEEQKEGLRERFDAIFMRVTSYSKLTELLLRIHSNKSELLLVLDRPEIPLHTNDSERDIRDHVVRQKISGGTRSDEGRRCRDTFSSLNKTCRKLGISFWQYMLDRVFFKGQILPLNEIIEQRIAAS
jgi:hypothetical protein